MFLSLFFKFWSEGKTLFFLKKKTYEYGDVHVMQDAQDDRSQICLNYVTKGPNVFANISLNPGLHYCMYKHWFAPCVTDSNLLVKIKIKI